MGSVRWLLGRITGTRSCARSGSRLGVLSYPWSLMPCVSAGVDGTGAHTVAKMGLAGQCPGVRTTATLGRSARPPAWLLVDQPPRERPRAWAAAPPVVLTLPRRAA